MALKKGDIDGCDGYLPVDQIIKLEKDPNIQVYSEQSMRIFLIRMHNQRPPFNDVHVRRAISYAFDYDSFINQILKGRVARNMGPIPNTMWGAPKDLKGYTYDLEKAKAELKKASVKIDRPLRIHPMTGYAQTDDAALILQVGLRQLGRLQRRRNTGKGLRRLEQVRNNTEYACGIKRLHTSSSRRRGHACRARSEAS